MANSGTISNNPPGTDDENIMKGLMKKNEKWLKL
jgi:hypothetical protein